MLENTTQQMQEAKHIGIYWSIERLKQVSRNLQSLIEDVAGNDAPCVGAGEPCNDATPSLLEVLNGAGNTIAGISEGIDAKIEELKSLLF